VQSKKFRILNIQCVAATILVAAALVFLTSCSEKHEMTDSVSDRKHTPRLKEDSVTILISDSGVLRYRLTTEIWKVYDQADTPYWDFPEGLRFERFTTSYDIDAAVQCNKAVYYYDLKKWHLEGNVRAKNLNGDRFFTEELFWDQNNESVNSDSMITIIQEDKKIVGYGFTSNQTFTKYIILNPTGIFPVKEEDKEQQQQTELKQDPNAWVVNNRVIRNKAERKKKK